MWANILMMINVLSRMSSDDNSENGKSIVSLRKTDLELCNYIMMRPSDRCRHFDVLMSTFWCRYNSDNVGEYSDDNQCLPLFSFYSVLDICLDQAH